MQFLGMGLALVVSSGATYACDGLPLPSGAPDVENLVDPAPETDFPEQNEMDPVDLEGDPEHGERIEMTEEVPVDPEFCCFRGPIVKPSDTKPSQLTPAEQQEVRDFLDFVTRLLKSVDKK
mgnify:CR=1 FL=1